MRDYTTIQELLVLAKEHGSISEAVLRSHAENGEDAAETVKRMTDSLNVMRESVKEGLNPNAKSVSGRVGGQSAMLMEAMKKGITYGGKTIELASAYALAAAECNACMGRIVAAPTAGACGVLPGVLFSAQVFPAQRVAVRRSAELRQPWRRRRWRNLAAHRPRPARMRQVLPL